MKKLLFIVAIVAVISTLFVGAKVNNDDFGHCGTYKRGFFKGNIVKSQMQKLYNTIKEELDLNSTQYKTINSAMKEQRVALKKLKKEFFKNKKVMINPQSFMSAENFNKEAFKQEIKALKIKRANRLKKLRERKLEILANTFKKVYDILTPKQREKLIGLIN